MAERSVRGVLHQVKTRRLRNSASLFLVIEPAEMMVLLVDHDLNQPFLTAFVPSHSAIAGRRPRRTDHVLTIPSPREFSQVRPSIIKTIPVDVISLHAIAANQSKQLSVQKDGSSIPVIPFGSDSIPVTPQCPLPLVDPVSIGGIDKCVGSNGTISGTERNTHGIIGLHSDSPPSVAPPACFSRMRGYSHGEFYHV